MEVISTCFTHINLICSIFSLFTLTFPIAGTKQEFIFQNNKLRQIIREKVGCTSIKDYLKCKKSHKRMVKMILNNSRVDWHTCLPK